MACRVRVPVLVWLCAGGCSLFGRGAVPCPPSPAAVFAPDAISSAEKDAFGAFASGGNEFLFSRYSRGHDRSWLYRAEREGEGWRAPERITLFPGTSSPLYSGDHSPFVSLDGEWLYFVSDHPATGKRDQSYDLWRARRSESGGWGTPERLTRGLTSTTSEESPILTASGTLYFASGRPGGVSGVNSLSYAEKDIYLSRMVDGEFGAAMNLGAPISTAASEEGVYVTPDESMMILTVRRAPTGGVPMFDRSDLYVSRRVNGRWSAPRLLGPAVNTEADEFGPVLSPDGRSLLFTRDITANRLTDLEGAMDVMIVDACVLQ